MLNEMVKMKRGNALSMLFQDIFDRRIQMIKEQPKFPQWAPVVQAVSDKRQKKNRLMKELGLKTGKQLRKHHKKLRKEYFQCQLRTAVAVPIKVK